MTKIFKHLCAPIWKSISAATHAQPSLPGPLEVDPEVDEDLGWWSHSDTSSEDLGSWPDSDWDNED